MQSEQIYTFCKNGLRNKLLNHEGKKGCVGEVMRDRNRHALGENVVNGEEQKEKLSDRMEKQNRIWLAHDLPNLNFYYKKYGTTFI